MKELLNKGLKYILANPAEFAKKHKELTGEKICSYCPGVIEAKFKQLVNLTDEKITIMKSRKWRMKPGTLIDTFMSATGPNGHYTDKNITDEIAEKLIAKGYGKYFTRVDGSEPEIEIETQEESELTIEVHEKEDTKDAEVKDSFTNYSYKRLVEYCEKKGFDRSEWENFNRKSLIDYVRNK